MCLLVILADEPLLGVHTRIDDSVVLLVRNSTSTASHTVNYSAMQDKEHEEL